MRQSKRIFKKILKYAPKLLVILYGLNFIMNNSHETYVVFWPRNDYPFYGSLSLVIILSLLAGLLLGEFVMWRKGKEARQLAEIRKQQVALLEKENADLYDQLQREKAFHKKG